MAAPVITVLSENVRKVVVKVVADTDTDADGNITWANLSKLFEQPDGPAMTGLRTAEKPGDLICTRITSTSSDVTANGVTTNVFWIGASANVLLSAIPNETMDLVLPNGGENFGATGFNATNALLVDSSTLAALGAGEYFNITLEFTVAPKPA